VACIAQEVTEQVVVKQKLQASEHYFRKMTDTVPAIIWITEPDGSCSYLNKNWYSYTGQTEGEALGFGWLNATYPDDRKETERLFKQANADRQPFSALYRLRNKNGEYRWAIDSGSPKFSTTGEYEGMIGTVVDVHEAKQADQRIKESEARYHRLIFSSPSMICILKGEDMVIDIANDAILESWGKGKEIIGKPLLSIMPEVIDQGFGQLLYEVYHTGTTHHGYETPVYLERNGYRELVYYTFIYQPQKDENGEIVGVAIIANEVTTEALANKKIRANEENVRRLFQQTPVGIGVYKGKNLIIEQANDIMLHYWGRSQEEALNRPLWEVLPEAKSQGFDVIAAEVYKTGKSYFSPESPVLLNRNGKLETIYAQFAFEPRKDETGTVIGLMGIAYDVTEQVVSRKKVELNEQRYMNLIHSSPVAVYTCDKDGYLQLYNEAAVELWGSAPQIGKALWSGAWKTFTPDGAPILPDKEPMALTLKKGKLVFEEEMIIERPSGERRHVLAHTQPVFDESGTITGAINTLVDITEIRKAQQIIKEKEELFHHKILQNEQLRAKELEEKVKKRTIQLSEANEELLMKNDELGKMNKELESFAYISSHDLQEPLRKIQTFSARILKKESQNLSDDGKDYFERMQNAAKRMQALIDDLLAYSRTNTTERKFEKTDLNQIVQDVKKELREVIEEKQAVIETHEMCEVDIIPFQLHQLLHNLFSNALKFSKAGTPPRIFVKSAIGTGSELQNVNPEVPAGKLLPQEIYCHISVTDNGIGFEPEYKDKIFEIFQRLHAKEVFPGTGIGLAIVKKIVENHNGFIMATSRLGQGATFDIYLPQL
jgi:PAS domain S-box-containing protein